MDDEEYASRSAKDEMFAEGHLHHFRRIRKLEDRVKALEAQLAGQTAGLAAEIAILKSQVRPPDE